MATTATRQIQVVFSGDVVGTQTYPAVDNTVSPGVTYPLTLVSGPNTVLVPANATAVSIVPDADNTALITLKGVAGDTGVGLHPTDPSSVALDPTTNSFVLDASDDTEVRLTFS